MNSLPSYLTCVLINPSSTCSANIIISILISLKKKMAGQRTTPAGEPPDKYYKCHSKTIFSTIVCLFCEDPYHSSCFDRLKNTKRIGEVWAVCPKHAHLKLTSNFNVDTLSDDVKLIIAEIKATRIEVKQKEILDEIAATNGTNVEDSHNETIFDNNTELENLKI